jgi:hypothetical protein
LPVGRSWREDRLRTASVGVLPGTGRARRPACPGLSGYPVGNGGCRAVRFGAAPCGVVVRRGVQGFPPDTGPPPRVSDCHGKDGIDGSSPSVGLYGFAGDRAASRARSALPSSALSSARCTPHRGRLGRHAARRRPDRGRGLDRPGERRGREPPPPTRRPGSRAPPRGPSPTRSASGSPPRLRVPSSPPSPHAAGCRRVTPSSPRLSWRSR